jgi:hypothetical protein
MFTHHGFRTMYLVFVRPRLSPLDQRFDNVQKSTLIRSNITISRDFITCANIWKRYQVIVFHFACGTNIYIRKHTLIWPAASVYNDASSFVRILLIFYLHAFITLHTKMLVLHIYFLYAVPLLFIYTIVFN